MGRTKKKQDDFEESGDVTGEYKRPNAKRALEIYDDHIKPRQVQIDAIKGGMKEPWQMVKDEANVPKKEVAYVESLVNEDDDLMRQHRLRALRGLLIERNVCLEPDLVDAAEGHNSADIVPFAGRTAKPFLPGVGEDENED